MFLSKSLRIHLLAAVAALVLCAGCGEDDPGMGPEAPQPTHFEVSVKMSSITTLGNCENDPGNPGEFRYTLTVIKTDEFGNRVTIASFGPDAMSIGDDSSLGSTMEPIRFLMPREPGAKFEVEYLVGEYDGSTADFERHGWAIHQYDRNEEQEWAAGTRYETYKEQEDGEKYGILKFAVWNTREECNGYAKYIVRWKPVWPDEVAN
jgi:hypothetical protein